MGTKTVLNTCAEHLILCSANSLVAQAPLEFSFTDNNLAIDNVAQVKIAFAALAGYPALKAHHHYQTTF